MPDGYRPTPFMEANAILAAQEGDTDDVRRILDNMTIGEVRALDRACAVLSDLCQGERDRRRQDGDPDA